MGKIVVVKSFEQVFNIFTFYSSQVATFISAQLLNQAIFLAVILLTVIVAYFVVRFFLIKKIVSGSFTIFEVLPLEITEQSAFTTTQFFNSIHALSRKNSLFQRIFGIKNAYAFEIISTKEGGIRYLVRIPTRDSLIFKKNILSYLPGTQIKEVSEPIPDTKALSEITEFKLSNHFAFPLKKQAKLEEYDPIAYITGSMTKLKTDDIVLFQVLASPVQKSKVRDIKKISNLIYSNSDLVSSLKNVNSQGAISIFLKFIILNLLRILLLPVGLFVFILTGGREGPFLTFSGNVFQRKTNNPYQEELQQRIKEKLDQEVFNVTLRLYVKAGSRSEIAGIRKGFISAISSYGNSDYQSLIVKKSINISIIKKILYFRFINRLPDFSGSNILSVSEVSDIYHFPYTSITKTENMVKLQSRELPAPLSLKRNKLDFYFAVNTYGGDATQIGLTDGERRKHMYILGATGTGKSTLLLSMINQDITNGKGLCVIDPHGDLIENILSLIPEERIKDVVYFNPDDIAFPVGINLLELSAGLTDDDSLREKEFVTESIISLLHKLFSDKYSGPRMEYILRNSIYTAFTTPDPTLFTVYKLLTNTPFRNSIVNELTDDNLRDFWKSEFMKAGDYQKVNMISPITNKIGRFLFSPTAKRVLEQKKSTINFDEIMDHGKILLCDLSKGKIGEDNSEILGIVIMTKIQLAALKRVRVPIEKRRDFYLYVDEFQNFATPAFAQILSEARKYRLCTVLAHQTTSQVEDPRLVNITLANTGTIICFKTANPEDEKLIFPQFKPYINAGEIPSLPPYHFYMKKSAVTSEEPFSGVTLPVAFERNPDKIQRIIKASRKNYATKYEKTASKGDRNADNPSGRKDKIKKLKHGSKNFIPDEMVT